MFLFLSGVTLMNDTLLASLISAASGILGVVIASVIVPPIREHFSRGRDARYLAIRVVCVLDRYVEDCASTAIDSGRSNQEGAQESQVTAPPPPAYPTDINWRSIDHSVMYKLLALPAAADRAANYVASASENADPPDYSEFFEARSHQYSLLGLQAHNLTVTLRQEYEIPELENRVWDPVSHMKEQLQEIAAKTEQVLPLDFFQMAIPPSQKLKTLPCDLYVELR